MVVGLPHTSTTRAYEWCAYSSKVRRFCGYMTGIGYDVTLFAGPDNEAACAEHVPCISADEQASLFGHSIPTFDANHPGFRLFNERAAKEIEARADPGDILCLVGGLAQQPIADHLPGLVLTEPFIGYGGVIPHAFHCFESYAWMHAVLGASSGGDAHSIDGRFFDCVVPNSYDPADFPMGAGDGRYLLYVGRLIDRKGLAIIREIMERTDLPLIAAGAGDTSLLPSGTEYVGVVGPERRAQLMGGAVALLAPTRYLGPFEGVVVEAAMTGTPAITTDFGAFTETVEDGVTGFRCHTLAEFCQAVTDAPLLDRTAIRERAVRLYSLDAAAVAYDRWFRRLETLKAGGWYEGAPPVLR